MTSKAAGQARLEDKQTRFYKQNEPIEIFATAGHTIRIFSARYGSQKLDEVDCVAQLEALVDGQKLVVLGGAQSVASIGDPAPGKKKILRIEYVFIRTGDMEIVVPGFIELNFRLMSCCCAYVSMYAGERCLGVSCENGIACCHFGSNLLACYKEEAFWRCTQDCACCDWQGDERDVCSCTNRMVVCFCGEAKSKLDFDTAKCVGLNCTSQCCCLDFRVDLPCWGTLPIEIALCNCFCMGTKPGDEIIVPDNEPNQIAKPYTNNSLSNNEPTYNATDSQLAAREKLTKEPGHVMTYDDLENAGYMDQAAAADESDAVYDQSAYDDRYEGGELDDGEVNFGGADEDQSGLPGLMDD